MERIRWEMYPVVADHERGRAWLQLQANLQLASKTIDAYGRGLDDFLRFCAAQGIVADEVSRGEVALYVADLARRPHRRGARIVHADSRAGLANATMQQRITVVRLFCDYLVESGHRADNPVGRGRYVPGKGFGGMRSRGLLPRYRRLPWIPDDTEWLALVRSLRHESLRNRLMLLLAYDGALRRQELVTLRLGDCDFSYRQITVASEHAKNRQTRVVGYGEVAGRFLAQYLEQRRTLTTAGGAVFVSESRRNHGQPLSLVTWSKVVEGMAQRCDLPRFTTHTPRHLRLTHLARAGMDLHQIALYAGHKSLETTMQYIHLSGVELTESVRKSLAGFEGWLTATLGLPSVAGDRGGLYEEEGR